MNKVKVPFNKDLQHFLAKEGYTHILTRTDDIPVNNIEDNEVILEPLKANDPRLKFEEATHIINEIWDDEVSEMTYLDAVLEFYVMISKEEDLKYFKSKK